MRSYRMQCYDIGDREITTACARMGDHPMRQAPNNFVGFYTDHAARIAFGTLVRSFGCVTQA